MTHRLPTLALGVALWFLAVAPALAQQQGQQMQRQMQQLQQMQQQMAQLVNRTHMFSQSMAQHMQGTKNQQRRMQMLQMQRLGEHMNGVATQLKNATEQCQLMLQDREMLRDRNMDQDMTRLRERLQTMTGDLEESVQAMERLQERIENAETASN
jgi:hypothetical protein